MQSPPTSVPSSERHSRETPLPDFTAVDIGSVPDRSGHPVLSSVVSGLLQRWPSADEAVADFGDSAATERF
ncbi:hypothetical protein [Actinacidiphila glaucinigra]|uniref:hypothetical protein n=1 Tax=Actinacidiphila glaucinigra TaxID=235986 RepID=UPI0011805D19|nr:hypothetical protein [Actinacidiphila glaucinigra]